MKKTIKMKKTVLGISLLLLSSTAMINTVEAQWSVIDVNSNSLLDSLQKGLTGVQNAIQGLSKNQEAQVKQTDQYQQDTDKRNRLATLAAESVKRDLNAMPTLQQCAEMTDRASNSASYQATGGGGRGGGKGSRNNVKTFESTLSKIVNTAAAQSQVLDNVAKAQTCGGGMDSAINGCSSDEGKYAYGDVNQNSLKGDLSTKNKDTGIMTNSLTPEAYEASLAYIKNSTLYDAPQELTPAQAAKNPAYVSMYKKVIGKLNASYETFVDIASLRKAAIALPSGFAGQKWEDGKADYKATFGVDAPPIPSFYEVLNLSVMKDYIGPKNEKEESYDEKALLQDINNRLKISNVISLQQFRATENSNILLAHLLTQAVAPTDMNAVKNEAAKLKVTK